MLKGIRLTGVGILMLAMSLPGAARDPVVVIVHKSNELTSMPLAELTRIYHGQQDRWDDGQRIMVADQPLGSPARIDFYQAILGEDPAQQYTKANSPAGFKTRIRHSDRSVKRFISQFRNAIGYIHESAADDQVKVLPVDGAAASSPP